MFQVYDKYNFLITKQADADIEDFLNGEHSFKEYCREVKKYKKLFEDITYKSRKVGLFPCAAHTCMNTFW